jgi:hypothetical protein
MDEDAACLVVVPLGTAMGVMKASAHPAARRIKLPVVLSILS